VRGFATALTLRLPSVPDRVITDEAAALAELRGVFPGIEIMQRRPDAWPIDVDAVFDAALSPTVSLRNGGELHIEEGRAAVLIDVDTGTPPETSFERAALAANLAATPAIARHLRLRRLGGGIVIDFAGLEGARRRERIRHAMEQVLGDDPAHPQILGWTRLGHLEIVRPRRLRPLSAVMLEPQGVRKSGLTLVFEALRTLQREARARPEATWRLTVAPDMAAALRGPAALALRTLEARLHRSIAIETQRDDTARPFDIAPL
jgi:ribonuclease G